MDSIPLPSAHDLISAVRSRNLLLVRHILAAGVNPNCEYRDPEDGCWYTPLDYAHDYPEILPELIGSKINPAKTCQTTNLNQAILKENLTSFLQGLGEDEKINTAGLCSGLAILLLRANHLGQLKKHLERRWLINHSNKIALYQIAKWYRIYLECYRKFSKRKRHKFDKLLNRQSNEAERRNLTLRRYNTIINKAEHALLEREDFKKLYPEEALRRSILAITQDIYLFCHTLLCAHNLPLAFPFYTEDNNESTEYKISQNDVTEIQTLLTPNASDILNPMLKFVFHFTTEELASTLSYTLRDGDDAYFASEFCTRPNHAIYLKVIKNRNNELCYQLFDCNYTNCFYKIFYDTASLAKELRACLIAGYPYDNRYLPVSFQIFATKIHAMRITTSQLVEVICNQRDKDKQLELKVEGGTILNNASELGYQELVVALIKKGVQVDEYSMRLAKTSAIQKELCKGQSFIRLYWRPLLGWGSPLTAGIVGKFFFNAILPLNVTNTLILIGLFLESIKLKLCYSNYLSTDCQNERSIVRGKSSMLFFSKNQQKRKTDATNETSLQFKLRQG